MTASVRWNQATLFKKVEKIFQGLQKVAGDDFLKRDLARLTKDIIFKRVKSGKGVSSDKSPVGFARPVQLKPLSKGYKRYRRTGWVSFKAKKWYGGIYEEVDVDFYAGKPALGEFARPDKSNLTFSGQLLRSLTFEVKKYGFMVYIPETVRRGSKITNAQLARYLSKQGRPFMNLTAGELRIVKSRMRQQIRKALKRVIK
jgi:hypothetical protein